MQKYHLPLLKIKKLLTEKYKNTRAIFLIGSLADGSFKKNSDIDIVWIKVHKLGWRNLMTIEDKLSSDNKIKIQIVQFSKKQLKWHFDNSSTMAHSINKGIVLYGKRDKFILKILKRKLSLPTNKWMKNWYDHWLIKFKLAKEDIKIGRKFKNGINDTVARVCVNFAILYLEKKGFVPVSKFQIKKGIKKYLNEERFKRMKIALKYSGKDRYIPLSDAEKIFDTATYLKRRLIF